MNADVLKAERERTRWLALSATHFSGSSGTSEGTIAIVLQQLKLFKGKAELRRELDYLAERNLIKIDGRDVDAMDWGITLTRYGYDVVEYTLPCEPGIARPSRHA
jgi:hypothetical protein